MIDGVTTRHGFLLLILWAQVLAVAAVGAVTGHSLIVIGCLCLVVIALGLAGMLLPSGPLPASAVALGLAIAVCAVVTFSGELETVHLYFPVIIAAIAFYRMLAPLLIAVAAIAVYHFAAAWWLPGDHTVGWAVLHIAFLSLLTAVLVVGWRLEDEDRGRVTTTTDHYWTSFHAAPIGMAVLKPSGQFLEANAALAHLLDHEPGYFPERNIRAVIHADDMPVLGDAWEAIGNSATHTYSAWMRCLTADGGSIWGRVSLALVPRTDQQSAVVILQVEDATRSRREQDRLESLLHARDEFVAAVGSEIKGSLGTLIDLSSDDPVVRDIQAHAREAASVIDDLVASANAENAPPDVVSTEFDLATVCERILITLPGGGRVKVDIRARKAWADPDLTNQIVTGMLGNSIRYGGPNMRVQVFNSGPDTVMQVIDDGPGIPASQQERIFSGDLRGGRPVTRPAAFGLSLTVGRYLARRMDGDVTYRRSGDGLNIFELRLPSEEVTQVYNPRRRPRLSAPTPG